MCLSEVVSSIVRSAPKKVQPLNIEGSITIMNVRCKKVLNPFNFGVVHAFDICSPRSLVNVLLSELEIDAVFSDFCCLLISV
ncbi:unnamed protein product [Gongylonema pulchrum]|uniref:UmuC domain-containing protein n=1 Tax=Gongylonema pulchrum TaxID=637853 RepID=A0A183EJW0_9BILA|nr:unnamed protein product [Gongylonema pulchrum]